MVPYQSIKWFFIFPKRFGKIKNPVRKNKTKINNCQLKKLIINFFLNILLAFAIIWIDWIKLCEINGSIRLSSKTPPEGSSLLHRNLWCAQSEGLQVSGSFPFGVSVLKSNFTSIIPWGVIARDFLSQPWYTGASRNHHPQEHLVGSRRLRCALLSGGVSGASWALKKQ